MVAGRNPSDWLGARSPAAHRALRGAWHAARRLVGRPAYAERRRGMAYYAETVRLAREYVPSGGAALDVGAHDSDVLTRLDWFERRVALDLHYFPPRPGIESVVSDFMTYEPPGPFDLVVCLQVLQGAADPEAFTKRLLGLGGVVILSVPGRGRAAAVDPDALRAWAGREPAESLRVTDDMERLVCVYS